MLFCTFFKEIQESSPYIYTSDKCNNFVCVNIYYVMHITGGSQQIKFRETYAKSTKTRQSSLANRTIQFCQARPTKPEHPVYKTGTSGFSRLNILIRKNTSYITGIE
jgi:hypothetical protein